MPKPLWKQEPGWFRPKMKSLGKAPGTTHDRTGMHYVSYSDVVEAYRRQLDGITSGREREIVLRHVLRDQELTPGWQLRSLLREIGFGGSPEPRKANSAQGAERHVQQEQEE